MILKSSGKQLGRQGTFAKILIAVGELEILIGKMENVWTYDIDELIVKPIQKCICYDSDELSLKRNQIMNFRTRLKDAHAANQKGIEELRKEYEICQNEFKKRLIQEKKVITDFRRNLTKVLEKQLEMTQNSFVHLETLVEMLKTNPKKIQISKDSSSDSNHSRKKQSRLKIVPSCSSTIVNAENLPELKRHRTASKIIFDNYINNKLEEMQNVKGPD